MHPVGVHFVTYSKWQDYFTNVTLCVSVPVAEFTLTVYVPAGSFRSIVVLLSVVACVCISWPVTLKISSVAGPAVSIVNEPVDGFGNMLLDAADVVLPTVAFL